MRKKLTPWFSEDVKPARPGVYMVRHPRDEHQPGWSKWDGEWWMPVRNTAERAATGMYEAVFQDKAWRGLASDPGGK